MDVKAIFPSRALLLFLLIGFTDLLVTAILHAHGLIVEMNPLMKVLIERSEWLFAFVKALTLVAGWMALHWYAKVNLDFVRKASLYGAGTYVTVWALWFVLPLI